MKCGQGIKEFPMKNKWMNEYFDNKVWHRRETRKIVKMGCEMEIESRRKN